jgi:hypothetical protein
LTHLQTPDDLKEKPKTLDMDARGTGAKAA